MTREHLRHLGEFSGLARIAAEQRALFPVPGPGLRVRARDLVGVLDLTADDPRVERTWISGALSGEKLSWHFGYGPLRPREPDSGALHCHAGMKGAGE
ncbi:hypothetical protein AB0B45_20115 [Nonomuraea sp. NPDC049152]|uniref:hypothetical protein n=1 Tax=Nonomuraea sp. NPDC049152 TaxID=3154350 RepID=UPI0033F3CCBD